MHLKNNGKVLFNESTPGTKEIFEETLKNLKRQGIDAPYSLPGNTRVPIKVAHAIYAGDTRQAIRTDVSNHINGTLRDITNNYQPFGK